MPLPDLTTQLLTISVLSLQRQIAYFNLASRSTWNANYDFVVVGGGRSGAIVAERLSKNPDVNVLLLEVGSTPNVLIDMPGNAYKFIGDPNYNWLHPLTPQRNIWQAYKQPPRMGGGRTLGGTSAIYSTAYNRGNRRDFDDWEYKYGCRGWNYQNILKNFLRIENQTDPNYAATKYHATGGEITVSSDWDNLEQENPIFDFYIHSATMAGYPIVDLNGPSQNGVTLIQHSTKDGVRVTSASAFLSPNRNRTNLHIVTNALVTRILFNGQTASGVTFLRSKRSYTVKASSEIIIAGGTIESAKLLLLSGVGPKEHLSALGIPIVADLPVGNNFHDQVNVNLYFDIVDQSRSYDRPTLTLANLYTFYVNHTGPLSQFPKILNYVSTSANNDPEWPDVLIEVVRDIDYGNNVTRMTSIYGQNRQAWIDYWTPYSDRLLIKVLLQTVRPTARGFIRLASTNPLQAPLIEPNYFGNEQDLDVMVKGMQIVLRNITNIGPFASGARHISAPIPGCAPCRDPSNPYCDDYLRCYIRQTAIPASRSAGSCRCGDSTNPNAVVDERLRVRNVNNLRVIDGSIMPQVVNGAPTSAIYMIGDYGAQMIIDDNRI